MNRSSRMIQSYHILNRGSRMMQSYHFHEGQDLQIHFELRFKDDAIHHFHEGQDLRIHFEPKFRDDAILPHSRGLRPLDTFWTEVQGWCNPTTFMKTEVTGSILDRCPRMIQSLFILEDQGHRITLGQMPRDDTIPPHSRGPKSPDHFRTSAQGWYNTTSLSRTEVPRSL